MPTPEARLLRATSGLSHSVQDPLSAVYRDPVVLTALVTRDLRLAHTRPLGQLPLTQPVSDPQGYEQGATALWLRVPRSPAGAPSRTTLPLLRACAKRKHRLQSPAYVLLGETQLFELLLLKGDNLLVLPETLQGLYFLSLQIILYHSGSYYLVSRPVHTPS